MADKSKSSTKVSESTEMDGETKVVANTSPATTKKSKKFGRFLKRHWKIILTLLVIAVIAFLGYGYIHTRNELTKVSKDSATAQQARAQTLVDQISKTIVLPNETPTLATVNDVSKLQGQEFFKNAQNGDKVLVFPKAGRALLYRESTHMIIEYSKVDLNNTPTQ